MPYKKATSAAPAASHSRTQTTAKAAGERTTARESRRAFGQVVSDTAQTLRADRKKHRLEGYDSRLVTWCIKGTRGEPEMQRAVEALQTAFGQSRAFRAEMRILLGNLKHAGQDKVEVAADVALFAARMFAAGEDNGYYTALCERNLAHAQQMGVAL